MKSCLRSLLLFLLILPATVLASTTAPMFAGSPGTTLTIQGQTYTWTGPATEDGTWHNDTYTNTTGQTVTVTGMLGAPNLATVSGSTSTGTVAGYLSSAVYGDNHQTSSTDGLWQFSGVTYTHRNLQQDYSVDWNYGGVNSSGSDDYSGPDGSLHNSWIYPADGDSESHSTFTGGKTPFSTQTQFTVFGTTYQFHDSSSRQDNYSDANNASWTDKYTSLEGGNLQFGASTAYGNTTYQLLVWDPHLGTLQSTNTVTTLPSSSLTGIIWAARSAPSFAKPQLWLDGTLLNWQSGTITTAGLLTDTYSGAGVTLTINAQARDYFVGGGNAVVTITSTGGGTGTLGHDGNFILSGHVLQNASPNHSAPLFVDSVTVLRVTGTNYAFTGGFQDSLGNRIDIYRNPSYGMIVITGSASAPYQGNVKVSKSGATGSGTYSYGSFSGSGPHVIIPSSQPAIYGPPAFWVRGELYLQNATTPTSYASAASHSLTLTGTDTWTLAGTDATGAFSGTCSNDPIGVFLVQDAQGAATVPVIPANADGSLHLSWESAPTGMPPAVIEKMHTLVFLGTATDDTNSAATAAYYGSDVMSDQTPWLLKVRTDGSGTTPYTATYTDYSTATSTTGSYSSQTHLFQTSAPSTSPPGSGFPVPVWGVDPNANFALWNLSPPDSATGLPATFLVQGDIWRYTGTSGGVATYQGYYSNQQMTATALPQPDGGWVVQVTNPFHGDGTPTQGTLNDVRGSVRLRDGSEVYSGNFAGQPVIPTLYPNNLHTIAADLDITGNVITFGALAGNAATAGVTLQFQDVSLTASLYSTLARPQAQWLWSRAADSSGQSSPLTVMKLDATHKLKLYDSPASGQDPNAGVVLDPTPGGVSTIRGVLRVRPGGDIDMGGFTAGGEP